MEETKTTIRQETPIVEDSPVAEYYVTPLDSGRKHVKAIDMAAGIVLLIVGVLGIVSAPWPDLIQVAIPSSMSAFATWIAAWYLPLIYCLMALFGLLVAVFAGAGMKTTSHALELLFGLFSVVLVTTTLATSLSVSSTAAAIYFPIGGLCLCALLSLIAFIMGLVPSERLGFAATRLAFAVIGFPILFFIGFQLFISGLSALGVYLTTSTPLQVPDLLGAVAGTLFILPLALVVIAWAHRLVDRGENVGVLVNRQVIINQIVEEGREPLTVTKKKVIWVGRKKSDTE